MNIPSVKFARANVGGGSLNRGEGLRGAYDTSTLLVVLLLVWTMLAGCTGGGAKSYLLTGNAPLPRMSLPKSSCRPIPAPGASRIIRAILSMLIDDTLPKGVTIH